MTYLDVQSVAHAHYGQESTTVRRAIPALARIPLPRPDYRNGAKTGLTAHGRRVLAVAHRGQQDRPTEILIRPSNACAGAKRLLAQLTPLQLRVNGRRGWPMVLRGATAEGKVKSTAPYPPAFRRDPVSVVPGEI